eukprot:CAMPEP_0115023048 /NCGR_PEP_ID=MMETSP0216-20121206/32083_1 /TAXON_ID=223996 /ORGANISM="Protocruzia adherens, Strain Boccale" /LENGTH=61 /DNA_ID=CAMNT_0002396187 /DNA_START=8 /DNA_END=193 /DNA_ORIENTATION=-
MPRDYALKFFTNLLPRYRVDEDVERRLHDILEQLTEADFTLKRAVLEAIDKIKDRRRVWVE